MALSLWKRGAPGAKILRMLPRIIGIIYPNTMNSADLTIPSRARHGWFDAGEDRDVYGFVGRSDK